MTGLFDFDIEIKAHDKFFLDDIFRQDEYKEYYNSMFCTRKKQISVLNKTMCGNGGTTGFIRFALENNKGLLILVPNVSICKSKEKEYENNPNICCVYGGVKEFDQSAQIVLATYDQFSNMLKKLDMSGFGIGGDLFDDTFWTGRTIIIDEYHKLIDDCGYREVCYKVTELIKKTESSVILMSATPHMEYIKLIRSMLPDKDIYNYTVMYSKLTRKYTSEINVFEVKKTQLKSIFKKMKESGKNNQIAVFYNNVSDIQTILKDIGDDQCEVLCGDKSKTKVSKYYSEEFNPKKKIHFMTSAYFTGHDINIEVEHCIIVGSSDMDFMCVGTRDIKQIIGRFRIKGGGVRNYGIHIFYMNRQLDQKNFLMNKNTYDKCVNDLEILGDRWILLSDGIKIKQDYIRSKESLDRYSMWSSYNNLKSVLTDNGYVINKAKIGELTEIKKRKLLSFKKAAQLVINGENVNYELYPDIVMIEEYMKVFGVQELKKVLKYGRKSDISNWYKVRMNVGDSEINVMDKDNLWKILGLKKYGRFKGEYIKACLDYIGVKSTYDTLPYDVLEHLGLNIVLWDNDSRKTEKGKYWLILDPDPPKNGGKFDSISIENKSNLPPKKGGSGSEKISFKSSQKIESDGHRRNYASTTDIDSAVRNGQFARMSGIKLYDWVNGDKKNRLPDVKKTDEWKKIKMFKQTLISEMYRKTDTDYRFEIAQMQYADCLIIDIDDGLSFSEFKDKYDEWTWIAYPTINNIPDDWVKFRVIVPLADTIRLEGKYNLQVLKIIRKTFCFYEDPNHQMPSFINIDDFVNMRMNTGNLYNVSQDLVDDITRCVETSKDYTGQMFNKSEVTSRLDNYTLDLENAKKQFEMKLKLKEDGVRHFFLYHIKKNLSVSDRGLFEDWLIKIHPDYLDHWKSHKV